MRPGRCKIFYSLAFICYLEAVLWTTLLLSGCAATSVSPEGSAYLHRETLNQGQADFSLHPATALDAHVSHLVLKAFDLHKQAERASLRHLLRTASLTEGLDEVGVPGGLRLVQALKGVPAPFAGIQVVL
mmetsp:Transcript_10038/g.25659  ORF Transcript_10038/g.25659 Transcript_10038/m.25659 type:complete len:130 (-) Transcript_10038:937-1326(-)|eukprot:jgi/Tetstr1/421983/TSEL_001229.t1